MWFQSIAIKVEKKSHFKKEKKKKYMCVQGDIFLSAFNSGTKCQKYPYVVESFLKSQKKKNNNKKKPVSK